MGRKFRTQLTITMALIISVTGGLIIVLSDFFTNREFETYVKEQQKVRTGEIADNLISQYDERTGGWNPEFVHGLGMAALYDGYLIRLEDWEGRTVWDAKNHDMTACSQVMMDIIARMEKKRPELKGSFMEKEYDLTQNGTLVGTLSIAYYGPYFFSESDFHFLEALNMVLETVTLLALLCSLAAGSFLARRISRPLIKTAQIADQIAKGNYKIRFDGKSNMQELNELVAAVNNMAASLDEQEGLRRRLTTDVAHELRTPLTAVASHLEAMVEGLWEPTPGRLQGCYEEIGRIAGLVADLEQLAKVEDDNLHLMKTQVDLLQLARTVAGNFEMESAKKNLAVEVFGEETLVTADRDRLNQVFANLLSNAIKYTPENGSIRMEVRNGQGERAVVVVEDNGIGIAKKDLPFIFERFYRTDKSRSRLTGGAGIGLAVVKSIVSAHGGTVMAESKDGKGSRFTVELPK